MIVDAEIGTEEEVVEIEEKEMDIVLEEVEVEAEEDTPVEVKIGTQNITHQENIKVIDTLVDIEVGEVEIEREEIDHQVTQAHQVVLLPLRQMILDQDVDKEMLKHAITKYHSNTIQVININFIGMFIHISREEKAR